MVREMSGRGNVHSGKCLSGEMSSRGSVLRGNVHRGSFRRASVSRGIVLGEVSVGELSAYPFFLLAEILFQLLPLILCHFQMVFQFCQYIPYCRTNQCKFFREIYFRNSHFLAKVLEIHG